MYSLNDLNQKEVKQKKMLLYCDGTLKRNINFQIVIQQVQLIYI